MLLLVIITVCFFLLMIPFVQDVSGLLDSQQAAVGIQNAWRIVFLWGLFTALFSIVSYMKKRYRMVTIFLILFWVLGTGLVLLISFLDITKSTIRCNRSQAYEIPREFTRALDLIAQRLDIENIYNPNYGEAFNFRNCLNIQYSDDASEYDFEGAFLTNSEDDNLQILLSPSYKSYDDLSIATILIHELTHVGHELNWRQGTHDKLSCFKEEAEAFTMQSLFLNQLNDEELRSIYARISEDAERNPALSILLGVQEKTNNAIIVCSYLREDESLPEQEFNQCIWDETSKLLEEEIRKSDVYKEQCKE